ncbi:MAG: FecR domain-containing protein [Pseudomonadota bacterium]
MTNQGREFDCDLIEEALSLLAETEEQPEEARNALRAAWRAQSHGHAKALAQAQAEWDLFASLPNRPLSALDRVQLAAETLTASATDHPAKAAGFVCALVALIVAPMLMPNFSTSSPDASILAESAVRHPHAPSHNSIATRYKTERGEQREVILPNGVSLWLNWNSDVLVAEVEQEIHVDVLLGDAFFTVPKNTKQPLIVHAGEAVAYAPDTEFTIHSHGPQDAFFQVKQGIVTIASAEMQAAQKLGPSQQSYFLNGAGGDVREANFEGIAAWREGKLVFDNRPLVEVLYELAHYTEQKINVGPIAEVSEKVSATFLLNEADEALTRIADAYDLEFINTSASETTVRSVDRRRL